MLISRELTCSMALTTQRPRPWIQRQGSCSSVKERRCRMWIDRDQKIKKIKKINIKKNSKVHWLRNRPTSPPMHGLIFNERGDPYSLSRRKQRLKDRDFVCECVCVCVCVCVCARARARAAVTYARTLP